MKKLFLFIFGCFIALVIIEVSCRIFHNVLPQRIKDEVGIVDTTYSKKNADTFRYDDELCVKLKPNLNVTLSHPDFKQTIITDHRGFRDGIEKFWIFKWGDIIDTLYATVDKLQYLRGDLKTVATGNSFTFGTGVNNSWVKQLGVLNIGVPSYSTTQQTLMLKRVHYQVCLFEIYSPQLERNVWFENWRKDKSYRDQSERTIGLKKYLKWSVCFNLIKYCLINNYKSYKKDGLDIVFDKPYLYFDQHGWEIMKRNILSINCEKLILIYFPRKEEVYFNIVQRVYGINSIHPLNDSIRVFAKENNIEYIDLLSHLRNSKVQLYFKQDGHLNQEGNNRVAEIIRDYL